MVVNTSRHNNRSKDDNADDNNHSIDIWSPRDKLPPLSNNNHKKNNNNGKNSKISKKLRQAGAIDAHYNLVDVLQKERTKYSKWANFQMELNKERHIVLGLQRKLRHAQAACGQSQQYSNMLNLRKIEDAAARVLQHFYFRLVEQKYHKSVQILEPFLINISTRASWRRLHKEARIVVHWYWKRQQNFIEDTYEAICNVVATNYIEFQIAQAKDKAKIILDDIYARELLERHVIRVQRHFRGLFHRRIRDRLLGQRLISVELIKFFLIEYNIFRKNQREREKKKKLHDEKVAKKRVTLGLIHRYRRGSNLSELSDMGFDHLKIEVKKAKILKKKKILYREKKMQLDAARKAKKELEAEEKKRNDRLLAEIEGQSNNNNNNNNNSNNKKDENKDNNSSKVMIIDQIADDKFDNEENKQPTVMKKTSSNGSVSSRSTISLSTKSHISSESSLESEIKNAMILPKEPTEETSVEEEKDEIKIVNILDGNHSAKVSKETANKFKSKIEYLLETARIIQANDPFKDALSKIEEKGKQIMEEDNAKIIQMNTFQKAMNGIDVIGEEETEPVKSKKNRNKKSKSKSKKMTNGRVKSKPRG